MKVVSAEKSVTTQYEMISYLPHDRILDAILTNPTSAKTDIIPEFKRTSEFETFGIVIDLRKAQQLLDECTMLRKSIEFTQETTALLEIIRCIHYRGLQDVLRVKEYEFDYTQPLFHNVHYLVQEKRIGHWYLLRETKSINNGPTFTAIREKGVTK